LVAARGARSGGFVARYAAALFELAEERRELDAVAADLAAVKAMLAASADLRRAAASPLIDRGVRARAMAELLEAAGAGDLVRRFVGVIAQNRRLFALGPMIEAFLAELAARRGKVTAEVVAAHPLSPAQEAALREAVRRAVGGQVKLEIGIDRALIGGLTVKVGSRMFDGSLESMLQRLHIAMKGAA